MRMNFKAIGMDLLHYLVVLGAIVLIYHFYLFPLKVDFFMMLGVSFVVFVVVDKLAHKVLNVR